MKSPSREAPIHLLLTSVAAAGHINPLIQLAHFLIKPRPSQAACYVTLALLTNAATETQLHTPSHERLRILTMDGFDMNEWFYKMTEIDEVTARMLPLVTKTHKDWPAPKALIFDFMSTFGVTIAQQLEIPSFVFLSSPLFCFWSLMNYESLKLLYSKSNPPKVYEIPGIGEFTLTPLEEDEMRKNARARLFQNCRESYQKASGCITNDLEFFYSPEFLASLPPKPLPQDWATYCCGPLAYHDPRTLSEASNDNDRKVGAFADRFPQRTVLYIALGSCWSLSSRNLVELARGVAATGRPFIFAHRNRKAEANYRALLPEDVSASEETEEDGLPVGFREEVQDRGLIVDWVNQLLVLRHPSIGAFVTHCGWNSIMECIAFAGVPFILLPIRGDQKITADFLAVHLKCGEMLRGGHPENESLQRERVAKVIESIFTNHMIRDQALQLHQLARQNLVEKGPAEENALKFFTEVTKRSHVS